MFQGQMINDQDSYKGSTQERTKTYHPTFCFVLIATSVITTVW